MKRDTILHCRRVAPSVALLVAMGCGVERIGPGGNDGPRIPPLVQEKFSEHCTFAGCHEGTFQPDLRPGNSDAILDGQSPTAGIPYVEFGNPSNSYLAIKMVPNLNMDAFSGAVMPMGRTMPPEDIALILGWIAGAPLPGGDTDPGTTGDPTDPTVADTDTTGGETDPTDASDTATTTATDTAAEWMSVCSLMDVNPDETSPVEAGDQVGMLPTAVGAAVENNCGCHLATVSSDTSMYVLNPFPVATHADFQALHGSGQPNHTVALDRMSSDTLPMPPMFPCDHDGQRIDPEEEALLIDWLSQGAPDGATYEPM